MKKYYALLIIGLIFTQILMAESPTSNIHKKYFNLSDYRYPKLPNNFNLDINGFYEGKVSMRDYNPKNVTDPRWETIRQDPVFNKLPRDVLVGSPKFDLRYKFNINGQVDDKLSVHYDIEQEPDFPGKYDIQINYDRSALTFFHFDTEFKNGEFINIKKALDGVKTKTETDTWSAQFVTGRQRSDPQVLETQGNGQKKLKLQSRSILEGSIVVYINNSRLHAGRDYTANYFDGEISFTAAPQQNDLIKVLYEFTNPIEDFIPALSRKNFAGAQFAWHEETKPQLLKEQTQTTETLWPNKTTANTTDNPQYLEFQLQNKSILLGSDTVYLNLRKLIRNKDYFVRNLRGKLVLQNITLTALDTLKIIYSSYISAPFSEDIIGNNTPGPYALNHDTLLQNSVKVAIDESPLTEGLDYSIDYELGRILFNYKIQYPKIISIDYTAIKTHPASGNIQDSPLSASMVFMNESTQGQADTLIINQVETATITGNQQIRTNKTPILTDQPFSVLVAGVPVSANILNAYTGIIQLVGTLPVSPSAQVTYSYKKNFATTFQFSADNRGNQPYLATDISLRETPIKYLGVNEIRVFGKVGSLENSSSEFIRLRQDIEYTINYDETNSSGPGVNVEIRFIRHLDNSASTLPDYPNDKNQVTLFYSFTPKSSPDEGKLSQTMIGTTLKAKITDQWSGEIELAGTHHNFSKPKTEETKTIVGNGSVNFTYTIGRTDIAQDSDSVTVENTNGNTLLTRDVDYFINYSSGTIRFKNLNPSTQDTIRISYQYFDSARTTSAGKQQPFKLATRIATTYQDQGLTLKADYKNIDKDFFPISPINDKKGSQSYSGLANWQANETTLFNLGYISKKTHTSGKTSPKDIYFHEDETKANAEFRVLDIFDNKLTTRYFTEVEDQKIDTSLHDTDRRTIGINLTTDFGPDYLRNTVIYGLSKQDNDYIDKINFAQSNSNAFTYKSMLRLSKVPILGDIAIGPEYALANTEIKTKTSLETTLRNTYAGTIEIKPLDILRGSFSYQFDTLASKKAITSANAVLSQNLAETEVANQTINVDYTPFSWIDTGYSFQKRESQSPLVGQKGELSESASFKIKNFSLYGLLYSSIGSNILLTDPLKGSFFTYATTLGSAQQNNNLQNRTDNNDNYSFNNFEPYPGIKMRRALYEIQKTFSKNTINSSTTSENIYSRNYAHTSGDLGIGLEWLLFNLFDYQLTLDKKEESRLTKQLANKTTITSNVISEELPEFTRSQRLNLKMPLILNPINAILHFDIGKASASLGETITERNNLKTSLNPKTDKIIEYLSDSSATRLYQLDTTYAPLNLFNTTNSILLQDETYNRNQNTSQKGTIHKSILNGKTETSFSLLGNLPLSLSYNRNRLLQYTSPSINSTQKSIDQTLGSPTTPTYNQRIYTKDHLIQSGLTFTPFGQWDLKLGGKYQLISEQITTRNTKTSDISQASLLIGTTYRPLPGLSLFAEAELKETSVNKKKQGNGQTLTTGSTYLPVQTKNFNVKITYDVKLTKGVDLNSLSKETILRGSGAASQTQVNEQDNAVHNGSLSINIIFPITNTAYIQNIVITGEGYIKKIEDKKIKTNTYDITGVLVKGTLNF
ncbi:MAG: hypothetical protein EXS67_01220 [Candidatus Margulisbacteria bacterium]|nr:hypothetical protein [Candidatus Margulisiibacteriota bacterium]